MEFQKNIRNGLLKRQEVSLIVERDKNPSFDEMKKIISEESSNPEENIDVYNINGKFGRGTFLIKAYIYDFKEELEKIKELSKTKKQRKIEFDEKKKIEDEAKKAAEKNEVSEASGSEEAKE